MTCRRGLAASSSRRRRARARRRWPPADRRSSPSCEFSVSYTTRAPRARRGRRRRLQVRHRGRVRRAWSSASEFAEWAVVHGNRYGTAVAHGQPGARGRQATTSSTSTSRAGAQIRRQWPRRERAGASSCRRRWPSSSARLRRRATDAPDGDRAPAGHGQATSSSTTASTTTWSSTTTSRRASSELPSIYVAARCARRPQGPLAEALLGEAERRDSAGARLQRPPRDALAFVEADACGSRTSSTQVQGYDPAPTSTSSSAASPSPPSATPASCAAPAIPTSSTRWAWRAIIAELRLDVPSVCAGPAARLRRGHQRHRRGHRPPLRHRDPVPRRGRHQARPDPLDHARGAPGGELPQDAAGDGARHPRHPDQARRSRRQHADAGAHAARQAGADRARDAWRSTRRSPTGSASSG